MTESNKMPISAKFGIAFLTTLGVGAADYLNFDHYIENKKVANTAAQGSRQTFIKAATFANANKKFLGGICGALVGYIIYCVSEARRSGTS